MHGLDTWIHNCAAVCIVNTWFATYPRRVERGRKKARPAENPCTMETVQCFGEIADTHLCTLGSKTHICIHWDQSSLVQCTIQYMHMYVEQEEKAGPAENQCTVNGEETNLIQCKL